MMIAGSGCSKTASPEETRAYYSGPPKPGPGDRLEPNGLVASGTAKSYPTPTAAVVAPGTRVSVRLNSALSTHTNRAGETFTAELAQPLEVNGRVIAPRGSRVTGVVADSNPGGRVKGVAHIALRLSEIQLASGANMNVSTDMVTVNAHTTKKRDATAIGVTSGVGAALGAIFGGGKGAAIGAGAGAGAGTAGVLATHGAPAVIAAESVLSFTLR